MPKKKISNKIAKKSNIRNSYQKIIVFVIIFVLFGVLLVVFSNASTLKPPIRGLVDRKGMPPERYRQVMGGYVVNVNWSELQPNNTTGINQPIKDDNEIDRQISIVRRHNTANPDNQLKLKLRVFAGRFAPQWVKNIGGDPIVVVDETDDVRSTAGRFWTKEYGEAYEKLQQKLALKYDSVPEIADVAMSRCTLTYAEPLIRHIASAETKKNLLDAGYSMSNDMVCQNEQINAHKVWAQTRSSIAVNPYQVVERASDGSAKGSTDLELTSQIALNCRKILGARCIVGNNSIRSTFTKEDSQYGKMYKGIQSLGPAIYFQTATAGKIDDWRQTLEKSIEYGANYVELPSGEGGYQSWPIEDSGGSFGLAHYNNLLKANPISPTGSGDEKNPTAPKPLRVSSTTKSSVTLNWRESYDESGIKEYRVYRQKMPEKPLAVTKNLYTTINDLDSGGNYFFYVIAVDNSGRSSEASNVVNARTK